MENTDVWQMIEELRELPTFRPKYTPVEVDRRKGKRYVASARDLDIVSQYTRGLGTLQTIGDQYGITRERVRQILDINDVDDRWQWREEKYKSMEGLDAVEASRVSGYALATTRAHGCPMPRTKAKKGTVRIGQRFERWVAEQIEDRFSVETELMPNRHEFDIFVDGNVRIDVKGRRTPSKDVRGNKTLWLFNLRYKSHTARCDYFVCVFGNTDDVLVVPAAAAEGISIIGYTHPDDKQSNKSNKWDKYYNAWHLLER